MYCLIYCIINIPKQIFKVKKKNSDFYTCYSTLIKTTASCFLLNNVFVRENLETIRGQKIYVCTPKKDLVHGFI